MNSVRYLTAAELAEELHVSIRTLRRLVADGSVQRGSYLRVGRQLRFRRRVLGEVGATKTTASRRTIALAPDLVQMIRDLRPLHPDPEAPIFLNPRGNPVETRAFSKWIWIPVLRALHMKQRRLYSTRHTYISKALTAGANTKYVAEYVGTSLQMIEKHYGRYMGRRDVDPLTLARQVGRNPDDSKSDSKLRRKIR